MSLKFERDTIRRTEVPPPAPSVAGSTYSSAMSVRGSDYGGSDFDRGSAHDFGHSSGHDFGHGTGHGTGHGPSHGHGGRGTPAQHARDVIKSAEHFAESVGESLTGGPSPPPYSAAGMFAGPRGYLMAYIKQLESNPLRTKMLTAGTLAGLQEVLASVLAKDMSKHGHYVTARVPKMAAYGALVSAPLGHVLIWCLQKAFKGRTSVKAKILQILVSNLIMAPIQNAVYLIAMALIAGARTRQQIRATVRVGFWKVMKVSWLTSPVCLAFAQKFLPEHLWVPFFNLVAFVIGIYINTITKKRRLAALRKKHFGDPRTDPRGSSGSVRGDYPAMSGAKEDYPQMKDYSKEYPKEYPKEYSKDYSQPKDYGKDYPSSSKEYSQPKDYSQPGMGQHAGY